MGGKKQGTETGIHSYGGGLLLIDQDAADTLATRTFLVNQGGVPSQHGYQR